MAPRFDPELCTRGFTREQRAELPDDVWRFLLDEVGGTLAAVHQLTPNKILNVALGFIDSETGRSYWPVSEIEEDWQAEAPAEQVQKYVAALMTEQKRKHLADNPAFLVDLDPPAPKTTPKKTPKTSKTPKTPGRSTSTQSKLNLSGKKTSPTTPSTASKNQRSATASFSQESYQPQAPDREKSPTVAPDIPYRQASVQLSPTPTHPLRVTEAGRRIALGPAPIQENETPVPEDTEMADDTVVASAPSTRTTSETKATTTGSKRPAEDINRGVDRPPLPMTPIGSPNKRVAPNLITPPSRPSEISEVLEAVTSPTVVGNEPEGPPSSPPDQRTEFLQAKTEASAPNDQVEACGLHFMPTNLTNIPEALLAYVEECRDESARSAHAGATEEIRSHFQFRVKLYGDMYTDLQSRVRCLASDAKEKRRVEISQSLWSSRTG